MLRAKWSRVGRSLLTKNSSKIYKGRKVVKCPYRGFEGDFKALKTWKFRFYDVKLLECPKCKGEFNHYYGVSPRSGKASEFVIRIGWRRRK